MKLASYISDDQLLRKIQEEKFSFYFGIDPTAHGIHIGHLLVIQLARQLISLGHRCIVLIGGFTGSIGDPTGKSETRSSLDQETTIQFANGILYDIKNIFGEEVIYVNNKNWLSTMTLEDFFDFSRQVSVNRKLSMETFERRIKEKAHLSMSEFMYPEMQLLDYIHLNREYGCTLQIGGGDQWGNMSFGVHYLKKRIGCEAYAIATPLLTNSGKKISKTDEKVPFLKDYKKMYHYLLQVNDETALEICDLFSIEKDEDVFVMKKNIFKWIYQIYTVPESFEQIEKDASEAFYGKWQDAPLYLFTNTSERDIVSLLKTISGFSKNESLRQIFQRAIYIDGVQIKENIPLPTRFKLSIGKKKHFFIYNII
jgi:tyrosyl-tRNA synthetase